MKKCKKCHNVVEAENSFCPNCGTSLKETTDYSFNEKIDTETLPKKKAIIKNFYSTIIKLSIILIVIIIDFLIHSLFTDNSVDNLVIRFFRLFVTPLILIVIVMGLYRLITKQTKSLYRQIIDALLIIFIITSIVSNARAFRAKKQLKELSFETIQSTVKILNYTNNDHGVSFDYPSNWTIQTAQRKSTLILLYEANGSQATCNLSIVPQDQNNIKDYNTLYFTSNLSKIFKGVKNVNTDIRLINNVEIAWTTYEFLQPTNKNEITIESTTLTSLHKGQRLMLIINSPKENKRLIQDDIKIMTNSFKLLK